jgi:hypothetical protein
VAQVDELGGQPTTPLSAALLAGIENIAEAAVVTFTIYRRVVLPLDGYVFWVNTGATVEAMGSLHRMTERQQNEDVTESNNSMVFTTQVELWNLNAAGTDTIPVGEVDGVKYAFGRIGWYYEQANVWHYTGDAVNPSMLTQFIDSESEIDASKLIVSDSLPAWLTINTYNPIWLQPANPGIILYPSFAMPDNATPPFGAVHIDPGSIEGLQNAPLFDNHMSMGQLTRERVRVTLYGCNNDMALDFLATVENYSYDYNVIGLAGTPVVRDEKRPWSEGMILAQKKTIDFDITYVQNRINNLARQMLTEAYWALIIRPDWMTNTLAGVGALHAAPVKLARSVARINATGRLGANATVP